MRSFLRTYWPDAVVILLLCAVALGLSIFQHAAMRPVVHAVSLAGPVVFATCMMGLIAAINYSQRSRVAAMARRPLIGIAVGGTMIAMSMFRAEMFYAPIAAAAHETPDQVVAKIVSNDDVQRYEAWSRLVSMSLEEKNAVATALVAPITGADDAARASAELTLAYPLHKHTITTLIALAPDVKAFLEARSASLPPPPEAERAAAFASSFVANGYKSLLKALEPKNRAGLPEGGVEALFLALATNDPIGTLFVNGFATEGDDVLKAEAQRTLRILASQPTT